MHTIHQHWVTIIWWICSTFSLSPFSLLLFAIYRDTQTHNSLVHRFNLQHLICCCKCNKYYKRQAAGSRQAWSKRIGRTKRHKKEFLNVFFMFLFLLDLFVFGMHVKYVSCHFLFVRYQFDIGQQTTEHSKAGRGTQREANDW